MDRKKQQEAKALVSRKLSRQMSKSLTGVEADAPEPASVGYLSLTFVSYRVMPAEAILLAVAALTILIILSFATATHTKEDQEAQEKSERR